MSRTFQVVTFILVCVALLWASGIAPAIVPQLVPTANKRGTSTIFALAGSTTPGSVGATVCDDGSGNFGTTGCSGGGGGAGSTLFSQTSGVTVTGTTAETTLVGTGVGSKTLVANFFAAGGVLHVKAAGTLNWGGNNNNVQWKVKFGTTLITASNIIAPGNSTAGVEAWSADIYITCRTTGAMGTVIADGTLTSSAVNTLNASTNGVFDLLSNLTNGTGTVTIDTTATQTVDFTITPGNNGQSFSMTNFTLDVPGTPPSSSGIAVSTTTFGSIGACSTTTFLKLITNSPIFQAFCNGSSVLSYMFDGGQAFPPEQLNSFAWVNQGTATLTTTTGVGILNGGTTAPFDLNGRFISAPATPYHIIVAVVYKAMTGSNGLAGLCFRDSGSGNLEIYGTNFQGDFTRPVIFQLTSPTAFSGTAYNPGAGVTNSYGSEAWLRIGDDGTTNRTYDYSVNGQTWYNLFSESRTSLFTANQVGYCTAGGGTGAGNTTELDVISWQATS